MKLPGEVAVRDLGAERTVIGRTLAPFSHFTFFGRLMLPHS